jgi:hypothetical protein
MRARHGVKKETQRRKDAKGCARAAWREKRNAKPQRRKGMRARMA